MPCRYLGWHCPACRIRTTGGLRHIAETQRGQLCPIPRRRLKRPRLRAQAQGPIPEAERDRAARPLESWTAARHSNAGDRRHRSVTEQARRGLVVQLNERRPRRSVAVSDGSRLAASRSRSQRRWPIWTAHPDLAEGDSGPPQECHAQAGQAGPVPGRHPEAHRRDPCVPERWSQSVAKVPSRAPHHRLPLISQGLERSPPPPLPGSREASGPLAQTLFPEPSAHPQRRRPPCDHPPARCAQFCMRRPKGPSEAPRPDSIHRPGRNRQP